MSDAKKFVDDLILGLNCGTEDCGHSELEHQAFGSGVAAGLRGQSDVTGCPFSSAFPVLRFAWLSGHSAGVIGQNGFWNQRRKKAMGRCVIESASKVRILVGDTGSGADCHVIVEIEGREALAEWYCLMRPRPALEVAKALIDALLNWPACTERQTLIVPKSLPLVSDDYGDPPLSVVTDYKPDSVLGEVIAINQTGFVVTPDEVLQLARELVDHAGSVLI